ncbi:UBX domain-containing protein 11 isoform X1 [Salmo salar]|uniref:UBX domain-containing protein 11 isoform X1 n=2 Tax=Salmo salar TaxID=8030 RepID=A0ABM3ETC5_SALSA|nr:UBX domain-containing protein 11 isoform X1 [Salmo salar]
MKCHDPRYQWQRTPNNPLDVKEEQAQYSNLQNLESFTLFYERKEMSSPLSMLRKNRRVPLPGPMNQQGRRVPFKENPFAEYEATLLSDVSALNRPTPQAQATDIACPSKSKAKQRKSNSCCAPPSDFELMSSMMQRLTLLETKVKTQALDIDHKEKIITALEEKMKLLQKSTEKNSDRCREDELIKTCHKLQGQVFEMERFLNDYGMIWVGSGEEHDTASQQEAEEAEQTQSSERGVWQPETSVARRNFQINFDLVLQNIQQLNILAGEGESYVRVTSRGAQLAQQHLIPLRLYSNGIFMFNGPFRSYQEASTQQCMQDLMDGYFPSELQDRFADGVPFQVHDRREEEFHERRPWAEFPGKGQAVVGCTEGEKSTDSLEHAYCTVSQIPGRKLTMDQFLNRLPKVVVKAGRVIDIRDSVKASLQGSSDASNSHAVTLIDTPELQAMKERLELHETDPPNSARDVTTLRVKSEDGEHTYIIKMRFSETIGHLRQYLDKHRWTDATAYDIISAFPQRRYSEDSQTLLSCGLTPNAALLLRTRPGPPQ